MEPVISQQIWMISKRHWRQDKNPTNTIKFICQHEVPTEQMKDVTYGQLVCTVQPEKAEPNQTHFTVGGDRINYPGKVATLTTEMLVAKNAIQQRNLHEGRMLHDNRHIQLLPHDTITLSQIHPCETKQHTR